MGGWGWGWGLGGGDGGQLRWICLATFFRVLGFGGDRACELAEVSMHGVVASSGPYFSIPSIGVLSS